MSVRAYPPLPVRPEWAPSYLKNRPGAANRDFAFKLVDAEGMPSSDGRKYHGAVDWFAPGGTVVSAPRTGRVVRAVTSSDRSGPVYGGILAIEEATGLTWTMRHVNPTVRVGQTVQAGQPVATVVGWLDSPGSSHLHLEVWRSFAGGYRLENAIDPSTVEWTSEHLDTSAPGFYFEELPHDLGGAGPVIIGNKKGYSAARAAVVAAAFRLRGHIISTVRGEDGGVYVLSWRKGTYGSRFRFGPWAREDDRDATQRQREGNTGRQMRPFTGRERSLYPWPKEG